MSLTLIAITGILVGFLCLIIGFFMEDAKPMKKKMVVPRRKAA